MRKGGRKINIGIDIDGVINDLSLFHIVCGTKFCYEHSLKIKIDEHAMDSLDIFGWDEHVDNFFWNQYHRKLLLCPDFVRPYASYVTKKLCDGGHKIYIISARKNSDLPNIRNCSMYNLTKKYLENCNIYYNELFLSTNKWELINHLDINIMIEDNPSFFMTQTKRNKITLFCFNTPYNQQICGENIFRVYSWHDILFKINNLVYKESAYEN